MNVYVLHLFVDGVLSETRAFGGHRSAQVALAKALEEVGIGLVDGEVVDANGSVWAGAVEAVDVE